MGYLEIANAIMQVGNLIPDNPPDYEKRVRADEAKFNIALSRLSGQIIQNPHIFSRIYKAINGTNLPQAMDAVKSRRIAEEIMTIFSPPIEISAKPISTTLDPQLFLTAQLVAEGEALESAFEKAKELLAYEIPEESKVRIGLEIEVEEPFKCNPLDSSGFLKMLEYTKTADLLQNLGIVLTRENLREFSLPPTKAGTRDADIVVKILEEMKLIGKESDNAVQINIDGIPNFEEYLEDLSIIHLTFNATSIFGKLKTRKNIENIGMMFRKPVIQEINETPNLGPISIRSNQTVEFAGLVHQWKDADTFNHGLNIFGKIADKFVSYAQEKNDEIEESQMAQKAQEWINFRNSFYEIFSSKFNPKRDVNLKSYLNNLQFMTLEIFHIMNGFEDINRMCRDEHLIDESMIENRLNTQLDECINLIDYIDEDFEFWKYTEESGIKRTVFQKYFDYMRNDAREYMDIDTQESWMGHIFYQYSKYLESKFSYIWAQIISHTNSNKPLKTEIEKLIMSMA